MSKDHFITVKLPDSFNLELCLDCGQAFRWKKDEDGNMCGVIGNRVYRLRQNGCELTADCTREEFDTVLRPYFDLERDYDKLLKDYCQDGNMCCAVAEFPGIRILRQEPWETLCSFIISQNNNIPRIKGIIERLCEAFGEEIEKGYYSFPRAQVLAPLSPEDLAPLRAGFRAKYIIDAAQKVASGEVDLEKIKNMPIDYGREELIKIKGVGKKVAECTLLYGFGKVEAFPVDVWVKRIMAEMYPDGLPDCFCGGEGIAQQYLFHWRRNGKEFR